MNNNNDISITLAGNPILNAKQIQEFFPSEPELEDLIPLIRNSIQIVELDKSLKGANGIKYNINLLTENEGRETEIMKYINSIIEDVLVKYSKGGKVGSITVLDECVKSVVNTFGLESIGDLPIYGKLVTTLKNVNLTSGTFEGYLDGEGIGYNLEILYLNQRQDRSDASKLYNAIYLCLKTYINKGLQNSLIMSQGNSDSSNNCITVSGESPSLTKFYRFLIDKTVNMPLVAKLIDTVNVQVCPELDTFIDNFKTGRVILVLPNIDPDSTRYLKTIKDTDYMVFLESSAKYSKNTQDVERNIFDLDSLVDMDRAKYFFIETEDDGFEDSFSESLKKSDSIQSLESLIGTLDDSWDDDGVFEMSKEMTVIENDTEALTDLELYAEEGLSLQHEVGGKNSPTDSPRPIDSVTAGKIKAGIIDMGVDGHNPIKSDIVGWGEGKRDLPIQIPERTDNADSNLQNLPFVEIQDFDSRIHIVSSPPLFLTLRPEEIEISIDNLQSLISKIELKDGGVSEDKYHEFSGQVSNIFRAVKSNLLESIRDASSSSELKDIYTSMVIGDFTNDITKAIPVSLRQMEYENLFSDVPGLVKCLDARFKQELSEKVIAQMKMEMKEYRSMQANKGELAYSEDNLKRLVENLFE